MKSLACKYHALLGCKAIHEKGSLDLHLSMAVEQISQIKEQLDETTQDRAQTKGALRKVRSAHLPLFSSVAPFFSCFRNKKKRCAVCQCVTVCAQATQFNETIAQSRASTELIHDLRLSQNEILFVHDYEKAFDAARKCAADFD